MNNPFNLTGKIALITGGASGIGFGIARQFVALDATVVITGRSADKLRQAQAQLGDRCTFFVSDVTDKAAHTELIRQIETIVGPLTTLVNNAGIHSKKPSLDATDEEFQAVLNTNLLSVFSLTREALRVMIPRQSGSIINISSMSALFGLTQVAAYSSAKTALLGLTRTLASEYSHTGVRVNAVAPGFIESEMFLRIMEQDPARKAKILSRTPAGRFGTPADIGGAVAFLASDAAAFITGVCLPVDGGNSIGF